MKKIKQENLYSQRANQQAVERRQKKTHTIKNSDEKKIDCAKLSLRDGSADTDTVFKPIYGINFTKLEHYPARAVAHHQIKSQL